MDNKYRKYYEEKEYDWHRKKIGEYHISKIGCSHAHLKETEHSGPCLRQGYFEFIIGNENDDKTEGNFTIGKILHRFIQKIFRKRNPKSVDEFPIVTVIQKGRRKVLILGSADLIHFKKDKTKNKTRVIDIKSASMFTMPTSEYDYSPTHEDQVYLYTYLLKEFVFREEYCNFEDMRILYTKKHNAICLECDIDYNFIRGEEKWADFKKRVFYFDSCLRKKEIPEPEPMKWCRYCSFLEECLDAGGVRGEKNKKGVITKVVIEKHEQP